MTVKEKRINKQKGGLKQENIKIPNKLIDYFIFYLRLLDVYNDLFQNQMNSNLINKQRIYNKTDKFNRLLQNEIYNIFYNDFIQNLPENINDYSDIILFILQLLFSCRSITANDKFITKILKIYRHKLFIEFWYIPLSKSLSEKYDIIIKKSFELLRQVPRIDKRFLNSLIGKTNSLFNRYNINGLVYNSDSQFYSKKILPLIREIRRLFLSDYHIHFGVPVFYGNQEPTKIGYNEYICKIVGSLSSKKRRFIINPLAELIYRLIIVINKYYTNPNSLQSNKNSYIERLQSLLCKLLNIDTSFGFPRIAKLQYGKRFCIIKNNDQYEELLSTDMTRCSVVYGCSLIMSAEIREENLPLDEDIFEFLDILLRVVIVDKNILYKLLDNRLFVKNINNAQTLNSSSTSFLQSNRNKKNNISTLRTPLL
jgi:hypothetical protein